MDAKRTGIVLKLQRCKTRMRLLEIMVQSSQTYSASGEGNGGTEDDTDPALAST